MDFPVTLEISINKNVRKIHVSATVYPTKEDLNEFAKEQQFDDYEAYVRAFVEEDDDIRDIIVVVEKHPNDCSLVEPYIDVECKDKSSFQDFLRNKYQQKVIDQFYEQLTDRCNSIEL